MPDKRTYADRREYILAWWKANPEKRRHHNNKWLRAHPVNRKGHKLRERYGMSLEDYRDQVVGQAGRCLICLRVPAKDLEVDHNHATGENRGLLCGSCNRGIGLLQDNPDVLLSAYRYVRGL